MGMTACRRFMCVASFLLPVLVLSACGNIYSRDDFITAVTGKTDQEVEQQFGKPDAVDSSNPNQVVWVYKRKTFDVSHENTRDDKTTVIFERQGEGTKPRVKSVTFS